MNNLQNYDEFLEKAAMEIDYNKFKKNTNQEENVFLEEINCSESN